MKGCLEILFNVFIDTFKLDNFGLVNSIVPSISIVPISINLDSKLVRISAKDRVGPHDIKIISILFGSLLGDGYAEFRNKGKGTRFCFYQENSHAAYLIWLHGLIANLGYCNSKTPKIQTRLGNKGIVRKVIRFKTWTYSSFNWIHDLWYINKVKVVPSVIGDYITPLALAIWVMDDGCKVGSGLKLCTNSFTYSDCILVVKVLFDNFHLKATIQSAGKNNQYHLYVLKESMPLLRETVLPYVHPSMKYKLSA
uniref:LAGLIDADG endonuclease n=1 Tax=Inonotus hispidus TaxID=40469 RepID=UPI002182441C|nr:LAGLIDADG endonuclease [Inonotus hispidus]UVF37974.1 LAGLIDADG endonuclease [Inonotus hispidus]